MSLNRQCLAPTREDYFALLSAAEPITTNRLWLAKIVASWMAGDSVLPDYLGLSPEQFQQLCASYATTRIDIPTQALSGAQSDFSRMLEKADLIKLLEDNAVDHGEETQWVISLIVSACLGLDHLWQDLGVWERADLTALIRYNFPALAARNDKDMKWKKFLYKQLCAAEGIYICRAPSCEVCADYADCFHTELKLL